jgi:small subunit ribosomal protein S6
VREDEFTFIAQPEITEEGLQGVCDRYDALLEKHGAIRLHYDDWGRRRLAYEIQKFQKGHYLILHFLDDGKVVPELERVSKIDDSILRFLTVLASESVEDIEARKQEAARLEEERKRKAAERAAREAEEAAAREARPEPVEAARAEEPADEPVDAAADDATDEAGAAENDEAADEPEVAAEETNAEDVEPAETDADEEEEK